MAKIQGHSFRTSLGWFHVVWNDEDESLLSVAVARSSEAAARKACSVKVDEWKAKVPKELAGLVTRLTRYCEGAKDDFGDLELPLGHLTEFQRAVIDACRAIPRGQTRSYAQLAKSAGRPKAARAVGNVMRGNRWPILIPCHRVVSASGGIGGYTSPRGLDLKRILLRMEGAAGG